ncbi:MAG: hypothetical protein ACP5GJ_04060 [Nanopusillaceae archaeon]
MNITIFNVTNSSISSTVSNISSLFHGFEISTILIIIFVVILLFLISLVIRNILSSIIPKFGFFTIVMAVAYILVFIYYLPVYVPHTFTIVQNNTTVVNTNVTTTLASPTDLALILKFYSDLMYYMTMYKVPLSDILIPYFVLLLFYTYFVYALYPRIGRLSMVIGFIILFILSLGLGGFFLAALTYQQILLMDVILLLVVTIIAVGI